MLFQVVTSLSPANGRPIARVRTGTVQDYEACIKASQEAWQVKPTKA